MRTSAHGNAATDIGTPDNSFMDEIEAGICLPVTSGDYSNLDQSGDDPLDALVRLLARQLAEDRIGGADETGSMRKNE